MPSDHTWVSVEALPPCDFCTMDGRSTLAFYDGATRPSGPGRGSWANMCEPHFGEHGLGLGLGRGQRLVPPPVILDEVR